MKRRVFLRSTHLLLIAGGILAAAAVGEIALRVIGFSYVNFDKPDIIRGNSLRPKLAGWHFREGMAYVEINSHGYRDLERTKAKPDGVYRIAVLGDSFVEGREVALEQTFCAVLERMLNGTSGFKGRTVEVLNFGVSGYGTAQELLTLRHDVYGFDPDQVILVVFTANDVADNSQALSHKLRARPYFMLRGDQLVLDTSFRQSATFTERQTWTAAIFYALQDYSRLVQLAYRVRQGGLGDRLSAVAPLPERAIENRIYAEPKDDVWREAWRITERLIRDMHEELKSRSITFGVVTVSNPIQVHPDPAARRQVMERLEVPDLFYADRRIKALGEEAGFPVLNLAPLFQKYAEQHRVFLHGFKTLSLGAGHWNEDGHRLAAQMIAEWLFHGALPAQLSRATQTNPDIHR